jgi:fumarylacetoacetate (FAA) hydrolase
MKLVSYKTDEKEHLGIFVNGHIYNLNTCNKLIPNNINSFLKGGEELMEIAKQVNSSLLERKVLVKEESFFELLAPIPHPNSLRDAYSFRRHVETSRKNRNQPMIPEFDQFPVFYFGNHNSVLGTGEVECMADHFHKLDFELEIGIVIGEKGINIEACNADSYIAGFLILNDLSARTLQIEEMVLNLGPAKGKDFATAIGPWLVTPDELEPHKIKPKPGHTGNSYNLSMNCRINGIEVSRGNMKEMEWTFAEIIERCSYGCEIYPGDLIGSGTVGTGCFLELNGTGTLSDPNYKTQWLAPGDIIEMEITGLGRLINIIKKSQNPFSILELKK